MGVKRLLVAFRTKQIAVFAGMKELDMRSAIQRYDDHTGSTLLTFRQANSLLRVVAPNLIKLVIGWCDVMSRIHFPVLKVIDGSGSHCEDRLYDMVIHSCPVLEEISVGTMDKEALATLTMNQFGQMVMRSQSRITKLVIESFKETLDNNDLCFINDLKHFSITADCAKITDNFFKHKHQLVTVNLTVYSIEEDNEKPVPFSDSGVKVLLSNNADLKEVTLSGLPLTDVSLQYFANYLTGHRLERLTLKSSHESGFSEDAINALASAGKEYGLQMLSILSDDPEKDIIMDIAAVLQ